MRGAWVGLGVVIAGLAGACESSGSTPDAPVVPPDLAVPAALTLVSDHASFGTVSAGTTSGPELFTARNTGGLATGSLAATLTSTEFAIGADTCSGSSLAPGAACTFEVRFQPTSTGAKTATVGIGDGTLSATKQIDGSGSTNDDFNLASPGSHDFGDVPIGTTAAPRTFTLNNIGGTTHGPISLTTSGADPAAFTVVADTCTGSALAPGATCTFGVTFTPGASGLATAIIEHVASPGGTGAVSVRGTGLDPQRAGPTWRPVMITSRP